MKILVIGANGFLGLKILKYGKQHFTNHEFIGADLQIDLIPGDFQKFIIDITNKEQVKILIVDLKPDVTILTAAMTDVDACEEYREKAYKINALGPKYIAEIISKLKKKLIFVSTDFVFDGNEGFYKEEDNPNPISYYGESKLIGEQFVIQNNLNYLICRTSVLFGWNEPGQRDNFFTWAYKSLKDSKKIKIVTTQLNSPTLVDDLAMALLNLINFNESGILHTCGSEEISRYNFVLKLAKIFNFNNNLVDKIDHFEQKARRPFNSSLSNTKIYEKYGIKFKNIKESFQFLKRNYNY